MSGQLESVQSKLIGDFLEGFKNKEKEYVYFEQIKQMAAKERRHVVIDYLDLLKFSDNLAVFCMDEPEQFLAAARIATFEILVNAAYDYSQEIKDKIEVHISGLQQGYGTTGIADLGPSRLEKLVCLEHIRIDTVATNEINGLVIKSAVYCTNCGNKTLVMGKIDKKCTKCGEKACEVNMRESLQEIFMPFRIIQDAVISDDETRRTTNLCWVECQGELTKLVSAGAEIRLHAIVKARPTEKTIFGKTGQNVVTYYLKAVNIEKMNRAQIVITRKDQTRLEKWKNDKSTSDPLSILPHLVASFAPDHVGDDWIKEMLLCVAISGAGFVNKKRGWLVMFLVGDPSTGKTTLLKRLMEICSALYMAGEGIAETGLGAAIVHVEGIGMVAKAGFGPLGNMMVHILDEADKMGDGKKKEAKAYWNELSTIIEDGHYLNMRGGLRVDMPATGPWICAMNPVYELYDPMKTFAENVNFIPSYTLTRGDLLGVLKGTKDEKLNNEKIDKQVDSWTNRNGKAEILQQNAGLLTTEELAIYMKIAAQTEIKDWHKDAVNEVKRLAKHISKVVNESDAVNYVQRHTDALMRLCDCVAKLCWQTTVTKDIVLYVEKKMRDMYLQLGIDLEGPIIDAGLLYSQPKETISKQKLFFELLHGMNVGKNPADSMSTKLIADEMLKTGKWTTEQEAREFIEKMNREGRIYEPQAGFWCISK